MRDRPLRIEPPRGPVDAEAIDVASDLQREVDELARAVGLSRADAAWAEAWRLEGSSGVCPRSRALQAIANTNGAVGRLHRRASGKPGTEALASLRRDAEALLEKARGLVASLAQDGRVAA